MNTFTVQTVFLLYSAFSFLSALLLGALFWKKNDFSAKLWLYGCLLTSIATAVTVHRQEIPLSISYSLMVSFEVLSILLLSESIKYLTHQRIKTKLRAITFLMPIALFAVIEIEGSTQLGKINSAISALTIFVFFISNLICFYEAIKISKNFTNRLFFNFIAMTFAMMCVLYLLRNISLLIGYIEQTFDFKILNVIVWFSLALFGSIRNLAYIVLRLHLGFAEHNRLNNMNIKLSNILDERNEMILSLEKLNKSAAVNALASSIAHEINQPLAASKLNAQFLEMKLNSDSDNTSVLKDVVRSILYDIDRASTIIKNLSRLKTKDISETSIVNLLDSFNEIAEISKGKLLNLKIILEIKCSAEHQIKINLGEWEQVLINLINNAIEALETVDRPIKKITITVTKLNNELEIMIQDNGPGIPVGQELKIFQLMVTNKETGTGIGLWLSSNIINKFGGSITVRKQVEEGACFVIRLPSVL